MNILQVYHPSLPLIIGFSLNRQVAIVPSQEIKGLVDDYMVFTKEGYSVRGIEFEYGQWYDCEDELKEWLIKQNLSY